MYRLSQRLKQAPPEAAPRPPSAEPHATTRKALASAGTAREAGEAARMGNSLAHASKKTPLEIRAGKGKRR